MVQLTRGLFHDIQPNSDGFHGFTGEKTLLDAKARFSSAGSLSTSNSYGIWSASEKATTCNLDGLMMVNNG